MHACCQRSSRSKLPIIRLSGNVGARATITAFFRYLSPLATREGFGKIGCFLARLHPAVSTHIRYSRRRPDGGSPRELRALRYSGELCPPRRLRILNFLQPANMRSRLFTAFYLDGLFRAGAVTILLSRSLEWMAVSMPAMNRTKAPLIIIETDNIQAMEERVKQTGGTITLPTFQFPGGSRFHFTDPSRNELAFMQVE